MFAIVPITLSCAFLFLTVLGLIYRNNEMLIAALSFAAVLPVVVISCFEKVNDILSPNKLFSTVLILSVPGFCIATFFISDSIESQYAMFSQTSNDLIAGIILLFVGSLAFTSGTFYTLKPRSTVIRDYFCDSGNRIRFLAIVVLAITIFAATRYTLETKAFLSFADGAISQKRVHEATVGVAPRGSALSHWRILAIWLPQATLIIFSALVWSGKLRPRFTDKILFGLLLIFSLSVPLITASRTAIIEIFMILLLLRHYLYKQIPMRRAALIALFALFVLGFLGELRKTNQEKTFAPLSAVTAVIGKGYFLDLGKTSVIANKFPEEHDLLYGYSLALSTVAFIPRQIWPEKPIVRIGYFVGQEVIKLNNETGIPPGFVAELYMNFHYAGMIPFMILIGLLVGTAYKRMLRYDFSLGSVIFYVMVIDITIFSLFSGDFVYAVFQTLTWSVLLMTILRFVCVRRPTVARI